MPVLFRTELDFCLFDSEREELRVDLALSAIEVERAWLLGETDE